MKLKEYIKSIKNIEKIELLPYHLYGINKYEKLGIDYKLKGTEAMDIEKCNELYKLLVNKKES